MENLSKDLQLKYPLLFEEYDILECPQCDTICYPTKLLKNGTIRYNTHKCIPSWMPSDNLKERNTKNRSFGISVTGELIEAKYL